MLIRIGLGLACLSFVASLLVFLPINGPLLYGVLALVVILLSLRTLKG